MDDRFSNEKVLKPHTMWSEGRCFRVVGDFHRDRKTARLDTLEATEMDEYDQEFEESVETEFDIKESTPGGPGKFEVSLQIPSACFGYIIGQGNKTRSEIEKRTGTRINIPKSGQTGNVYICGCKKDGVARACQLVMKKVAEKRAKSDATHFVGIPVNTTVILESFTKFKDDVMTYDDGIDELLFQSPMKLHITMGAMTLLDDSEVKRVSRLLEEFTATVVSKITQGKPIKFKVIGVNIMRDDPERTDVLYGCIEEEDNLKLLQEIGNTLITFLENHGFGNQNHNRPNIKLHVTLMNSRFKRKKYEQELQAQQTAVRPNFRGSDFCYDSRKILQNYKKVEFGSVSAERFRLCCCGSVGPDGSHKYVNEYVFTK